jgi:hypothetical protein
MINRSLRGRWRIAAATAAALLLGATLSACTSAPSLEAELVTTVEASGAADFSLASLDSVTGSSFLIVCPYDSMRSVEDRLGFAWDDAPDYSQSDDAQTVVVVDGAEVVSQTELARDEIDFCSEEAAWTLLPTDTPLEPTSFAAVARIKQAA